MSKWFVSTPFADFLVEGIEGVVASAPHAVSELVGLAIESAKEICAARGWSMEPA